MSIGKGEFIDNRGKIV